MGRYHARRLRQDCGLAAIAAILTALAFWLTPPPDFRHRASMATAYSALFFLSWSLLLGPWHVLRRRPLPVSFDLRRDTGVAAGLLALLHTGIGLTVHLRGRMWMYFLRRLHPPRLQTNAFGAANYTGLSAAAVLLMLLAISNDISLRRIGGPRWKNLQRWTYAAFALTAAHGILFQTVENRKSAWVVASAMLILVTVVGQALAFVRRRRAMRISAK